MPRPVPGPDPAALAAAGYDPATLAAIAASPAVAPLAGGPPLPSLLLLLAALDGEGSPVQGAARRVCGTPGARVTVRAWLAWLGGHGLAEPGGAGWQLTGAGKELLAAVGEVVQAHRDQAAAAQRAAADRAAELAEAAQAPAILEDQAAMAEQAAERAEWDARQGDRDRLAAAERDRLEAVRREQAARRQAEQAARWQEQARRRRRARRAARWAAVRDETRPAGGLTWALALAVAAVAGLWLWAGVRHSPAAAAVGAVLAAAVVLAAAWCGRTVAAGTRLGWRRVRGARPAPAPEPGRWAPGPDARWRRARDDAAARR